MSKKARRQQRREPIQTRQADTAAAPVTRKGTEFNPDYSDTIKDLKRIGTLAGTFVTLLILLSFFLR
jgi:hypothetical protein